MSQENGSDERVAPQSIDANLPDGVAHRFRILPGAREELAAGVAQAPLGIESFGLLVKRSHLFRNRANTGLGGASLPGLHLTHQRSFLGVTTRPDSQCRAST